jgi:hypothetical protein
VGKGDVTGQIGTFETFIFLVLPSGQQLRSTEAQKQTGLVPVNATI